MPWEVVSQVVRTTLGDTPTLCVATGAELVAEGDEVLEDWACTSDSKAVPIRYNTLVFMFATSSAHSRTTMMRTETRKKETVSKKGMGHVLFNVILRLLWWV